MPISSVQVLLISAGPREEFLVPLAELHREATVFQCVTLRGAAEFLCEVATPPTLIVLAQARPGEFNHEELEALARLAPLARFVQLLGSWCEGETRTGHVWPGATRVFWYEWPGEMQRNLPKISAGRLAPWLAPMTTWVEERYLPAAVRNRSSEVPSTSGNAATPTRPGPFVLVVTRRSSFGDALCEACRQLGYSTLWQRPDTTESIHGIAAIIWEGIQLTPAEVGELQHIAAGWPEAPLLALADFPRIETQERALAAGATALLAKPCSLDDLAWHLHLWCPLQSAESTEHVA